MKNFFFLFILLIGQQVSAQEVWSLEKCIRHAYEHNLDVLQGQLNQESAELDVKLAEHARYPGVNGSTSYGVNFGRTIDPVTNDFVSTNFSSNNFSVNSGVVLYNFGRLKNSLAKSRIDKESTDLNLESTKRSIGLSIARLYVNALFAKENISISSSQLDVLNEQLSQVQKRIAAGVLPETASLEIEAQIASTDQNRIINENNLELALISLKQAVRIPMEKEIDVVEPTELALISDADLVTLDEVYRVAVENEPSIQAARLNAQSADMGVKIAESTLYPTLSLGGALGTNYSNQSKRITGYEQTINEQTVLFNGIEQTIGFPSTQPQFESNPYFNQIKENLSYGFSLQLNIPIYSNYNNRGAVQRAKIGQTSASINQLRVEDQLKTSVSQAVTDARAAKRRFAAAEKTVATRKAAYDNAVLRYELGASNSFELLNNQNSYEQARMSLLIAKYDYYFATKVIDFYLGKPLFVNQ